MGLCRLKGALGTIGEEVKSTGEGDSTQLEVAVAANPSLAAMPLLFCDGRGAAHRGSSLQLKPWGPPRPPVSYAPPSPAMLLSTPAQKGFKTAPCRILNVPR